MSTAHDQWWQLKCATERYLAATDALHVVHPSTDVHGRGGLAGAAMTPHCAWQCNVVGAHVQEELEWAGAREDLDAILKA